MRRSALLLVSIVLSLSCFGRPDAEIARAREALEVARSAGAPDYAPVEWVELVFVHAALEAELAAQQSHLLTNRSYRKAANLCGLVLVAADRAVSSAELGKEHERRSAERAIARARTLLQVMRDRAAVRVAAPAVRFAHCRERAAVTGGTFEMAERALAEGRYREARAVADAVARDLVTLGDELEAAREEAARSGEIASAS